MAELRIGLRLRARTLRIIHNYSRLFAPPHLKATLFIMATVCAVFTFLQATAAGFVLALTFLWGRQVWITEDYNQAESAAANADRVHQQAQRERESRKIPPPRVAFSYDILGLSENATDPEIRTAFRKLVKRYHPDRSRYSKAANAEKFRQVQEAYADIRKRRTV
jgi:hypothetical protein